MSVVTSEALLNRFRLHGALLEGHFQLTSGKHSNRYVQCAQLLCRPDDAEAVCRALAARFRELGYLYVTLDLQGFRSGSANEALKWIAKK